MTVPPFMACTVPGSIKKKSPFFTGISLIRPLKFLSSMYLWSSSLFLALCPITMVAPSFASATYQHSVLPREPSSCTFAYSSSGWTWMERSVSAEISLVRRGNTSAFPDFPQSSLLSCHSLLSFFPEYSDFSLVSTMQSPFLCALIAQHSPVLSLGIS